MPRQDEMADVGLEDGSDEQHTHVTDSREQELKLDSTEQYYVAQEKEKKHIKPAIRYDDEDNRSEPIVHFIFRTWLHVEY